MANGLIGYRRAFVAVSLAVSLLAVVVPAKADTIQLGFILDRSGSIGSANWTIIVNGLAAAVNTYIPVGGSNTYEVSVVTFDDAATANILHFLVADATARTNLANQISAIGFTGGGTNFGPAFTLMQTVLAQTILGANSKSYVNFATDGVQADVAAGLAARNALIAAGVDNISVEGIGTGVDAVDLQTNYCYPGPCDTTAPYNNFPAQGFYISVANAQEYANAIGTKIQVVTQTPEPTTLSLLGIGLGVLGLMARRRQS